MNKVYQIVFVFYVTFVILTLLHLGDTSETKTLNRQRRYLAFGNISHFFVRFNFKANMVPWTQIFAQAIGFRVNWDDPPDSFHPYHHINRRSVYERVELLLDRHGLNGFHCLRQTVCEIKHIPTPKEIYFRILKIIFRQVSSVTDKWHRYSPEDCDISRRSCPFSLLDVSPYTDL